MSIGNLKLIVHYLRPQWRKSAFLACFLLGTIALQLVMPQIIRQFIDSLRSETDLNALALMALLYMSVVFLNQLVYAAATYLSEDVGWTATNVMRADLMLHCLSLDLPFHKRHSPGEMIERIDGDITALSNFFSKFVIQIVGNSILLALIVILLFFEDPLIGLVLLGYVILTLLYLLRLKGVSTPFFRRSREVVSEAASQWEAWLSATEDIRGVDATAYILRRNADMLTRILQRGRAATLMFRTFVGSVVALFSLGNLVVFIAGAYLLTQGQMTIGGIYLALSYVSVLSVNLRNITDQLGDLQRATASLDRIHDLYAQNSLITDGTQTLTHAPTRLRFENVTFGYEADSPILNAISFDLGPGESLGLVGRTGSGKTTISRLMFRFYDPQEGAIYLDDINIRDLPVRQLRQHIGFIPQDVQLFHGKLRDNLTLFNTEIQDEDIFRALKELELMDWYETLPNGLETYIEGNQRLSAGEAQLITSVRIFLQHPAIIVLDEASARIDPITEYRLKRAYDNLLKGRIAILIAHRLETLENAHKILLLNQGRVQEYGLYQQVANDPKSQFYALLHTHQKETEQ